MQYSDLYLISSHERDREPGTRLAGKVEIDWGVESKCLSVRFEDLFDAFGLAEADNQHPWIRGRHPGGQVKTLIK